MSLANKLFEQQRTTGQLSGSQQPDGDASQLRNCNPSLKGWQSTGKSPTTELHEHRLGLPSVFWDGIPPRAPSSHISSLGWARHSAEPGGRSWEGLGGLSSLQKPLHAQQAESSAWQKGNIIRLEKKGKERKEGSVSQGLEEFRRPPDTSAELKSTGGSLRQIIPPFCKASD